MNRLHRQRFQGNKLTFLCSDAVLGLSGVVFMLAGVAATGEEEVFSIMSAGIFFRRKYPTNAEKLRSTGNKKTRKRVKETNAASCTCVSACGESVRSRLKREEGGGGGKKKKCPEIEFRIRFGCVARVGSGCQRKADAAPCVRACVCASVGDPPRVAAIYIARCTRTARVKLPKLSFPQ